MASNSRVLIVDDDAEMREALGMFLSAQGHTCELAADAASALGVVERLPIDAMLCDLRMEGMNGLELLDRVKRTHPGLPVVIITAAGGIQGAVEAIKRGAFQYVTKPCDLAELHKAVMGAIEEGRRQDVGNDVIEPPPRSAPAVGSMELVGHGPAMRALHACIDFVSASSAPVVISGETGAGKELVARAIHARGPRRHKPFVPVNASAIPQDLLEAEMFGHVRGAFSGAVQARRGLLTEADGGTLLMDEIGDMPSALQPKLLRVLQFGDVRPVGSDRAHHVDVRIIAATHHDLGELVREGRFREDLYFRLNVLPVVVPALRDHREDIPVLAAHFLAEACRRAPHSPVRSISPEGLQALTRGEWPGNVRELATVVERAVVFGTDSTISLLDLARHGAPSSAPGAVSSPAPVAFPSQPAGTLRDLSHLYTDWVLDQVDGDKQRAAEVLGIDLSTLYRWQRGRRERPR